jgi:hypothetical protein
MRELIGSEGRSAAGAVGYRNAVIAASRGVAAKEITGRR